MVTYILLAMCAICTPIVMSMQKLYNKTSPQGVIGLWFYVTLASFFAILFFSISAKFCLPVNKITLIYSAAFAIICIASICFSLLALKRVNLVLVSIFTNAGALLIPVVAGKFIFDENLSSYDIIASAIILISIILPLLQIQKKNNYIGYVFCIMLFICGGLATIINKCYAIDKTVTTNNSFCFYTNVIIFIILICVFIYLISSRKTSCEVMEVIKSIKPKSYLYVAIDTAASNISSILILVILQSMAVSKFSVYSNALGTLSVLLTSRFIFKEKITPTHILCIVLSTIAVILNAF